MNRREPGPPKVQLYDLTNDIGETTDVAADHPEVVAEVLRLMHESRTQPEVERWQFETAP